MARLLAFASRVVAGASLLFLLAALTTVTSRTASADAEPPIVVDCTANVCGNCVKATNGNCNNAQNPPVLNGSCASGNDCVGCTCKTNARSMCKCT
jgi:hypothetical protein